MGPNIRPALTLLVGLSILVCVGCDIESRLTEGPESVGAGPAEMSREDSIRSATLDFVRRESDISNAEVAVEATTDEWARATVTAPGGETDPATVYLRRASGTWRSVVIGTAFAPDELDRMGVPGSVRPPE